MNRKSLIRSCAISAATTITLLMCGCNTSQSNDAFLLSQRGSSMASSLSTYYSQLATDCSYEPNLYNLSLEVPIHAADPDIQKYHDLQQELSKRKQVADALKGAYDTFGTLATGQNQDLDKSIANLQQAVVALNANHPLNLTVAGKVVPSANVVQAENQIVNYLVDLRRQPDLRSANKDFEGVLQQLAVVFDDEKDVYVFVATGNVHESYQVSRNLMRSGNATAASVYQTYVQQSGITVLPTPLTGAPLDDWIASSKIDETSKSADATSEPAQIKKSINDMILFHQQFDDHKAITSP